MELSGDLKKKLFRNTLKQGSVFWMRGNKPFRSDTYHMFVVLNYEPKTGDALILVNGTSQVDKQLEYLRRTRVDVEATTLILEAGAYDFIAKRTLFNCNSVKEIKINSIPANGDMRFIGGELSEEDVTRLIRAVMASRNVLIRHKLMLSGEE